VAQGLVVLVVELGLLRGLLRLDAQDEVRHGPRAADRPGGEATWEGWPPKLPHRKKHDRILSRLLVSLFFLRQDPPARAAARLE
jgi:hypothetical protein